jgi:hypothetical protein
MLSIAELHPPTKDRTFWDFSLIDPELIDFLEATKGREPILDFGPIPPWMFKGGDSLVYASDPDQVDWRKCAWYRYTGASRAELVDATGQQVAEYFARIASWYIRGGFTDELGRYHSSGYHYELPWWGVLNEPDGEYGFTSEQYTRVYDAVVDAIRRVSPATKFQGMDLAKATPQFVEYFLDPHHHAPGTPIDMASFHFDTAFALGQSIDSWQYSAFDLLSGVTDVTAFVDAIRKRLSPRTLINIGELAISIPEDGFGALGREPVDTTSQTPKLYWNLAAAFYAAAFIELSQHGADVVSDAQLVGYPPQMMPSIRAIDLKSGKPLPQLQVIRLLAEQLSSPRNLVQTQARPDWYADDVAAQAFRTEKGRRMLLVDKRSRPVKVTIESDRRVTSVETVDASGDTKSTLTQNGPTYALLLKPFTVAVLTVE